MNVVIRECEKKDIATVLELIKELAAYERAEGEVEVSVDEMIENGFGSNKLFHCYVAEYNSKIIGIALSYFKYSTWKGKCLFLEDIIVTEAHRKAGLGSMLFEEIIKFAKREKVRRLEWQVLEWNEPAIAFYKKYKARFDSEWINCKLTPRELSLHNFD